ncbi:MAG TPA: hemerythrin domain-containing protein [Gemmatimonadales bacterium]|nr:hemerythrin domain-containing protein [Gemmatimonadales bacterium]
MKATDALLGEHGTFYLLFDHLERAAPGDCQAGAALLAAALIPHAQFENQRLFPALEERIGPDGPLAVMRAEHDEIEGTLLGLAALADPAEVRRRLRHAIAVAREHFRKEEMVLFPMAERALGAAALERMGAEWSAARGVAAG